MPKGMPHDRIRHPPPNRSLHGWLVFASRQVSPLPRPRFSQSSREAMRSKARWRRPVNTDAVEPKAWRVGAGVSGGVRGMKQEKLRVRSPRPNSYPMTWRDLVFVLAFVVFSASVSGLIVSLLIP